MNVKQMPKLSQLLARIETLELLVAALIAEAQKSDPARAATLRAFVDDAQWQIDGRPEDLDGLRMRLVQCQVPGWVLDEATQRPVFDERLIHRGD